MTKKKFQRNRFHYLLFILTTVALGLASRTDITPQLIYPYIGDILYAVMFFFIIGFLFPKRSSLWVIVISVMACYSIELLQLYQAEWINNIRSYKLGGLVLGYGFLWSDMLCYSIGALFGYLVERFLLTKAVL
ncbi:DUF2809 domain-containing protein [Carboxylicivirga sp. N1Y90]|uniref:ribosomal maturation YjgA family protein n=1 Tax=Carboxylicivirga fragile TaxID=3417571 RepID=UPI003D332774|nr:DUF2809 domain-containing protein [Marinilabiliaceae bacterium N1Y90]